MSHGLRRGRRAGRSYYEPGGWNVQCDRTGFKRKASEVRREWNGLLVWDRVWGPRHPQDRIFLRPEHPAVPNPRPWGVLSVGPGDVTADDL